MNKNSILFLTKDAMCKSYLPLYGNQYWKGQTPNLDELAKKGTVYNNFFTAAPSSAMSYLSMFTRKYPYQQPMKKYTHVERKYEGRTLFDEAFDLGFECHILWDATWKQLAFDYTQCYGDNTTIHWMPEIKQAVGSHYPHEKRLERSKFKEETAFSRVRDEIKQISSTDKKVFLWCHLPHVLNGRRSFCDDIDLFDQYIGMFREFFDDEHIFISADHGNMNGLKGKIEYGFDVYDTSINIPFISPRIDGLDVCNKQVSNIHVFELIFKHEIVESSITFSDCAYYLQPHRKLAVINGKWRYIYNKLDDTEELYDIEWDPHQDFNLISDYIYDVDRRKTAMSCDNYFYPFWDELPEVRIRLRKAKDDIWRGEVGLQKIAFKLKRLKQIRKIDNPIYLLCHRK